MGDDLTESTPLLLLAIGRKRGSETKTLIIEKIEIVKRDSVSELLITTLTDSMIELPIESIAAFAVCQESRTLFVETDNHVITAYSVAVHDRVTFDKGLKTIEGIILGVTNGVLYTLSLDKKQV